MSDIFNNWECLLYVLVIDCKNINYLLKQG